MGVERVVGWRKRAVACGRGGGGAVGWLITPMTGCGAAGVGRVLCGHGDVVMPACRGCAGMAGGCVARGRRRAEAVSPGILRGGAGRRLSVVMARETGVCLGARVWVVLEYRGSMTGKRLAAWGAASGGGGKVAVRLCGAVGQGCKWVVALVAVLRGGCPSGG
jgi:hypothetical protein